jgi:ABC-type uncharacterized transport system permease subunit
MPITSTTAAILSVLLYLITAILLGRRLSRGVEAKEQPKTLHIALGLGAVLMHAVVLVHDLFAGAGLNLGIYNAISLICWMIALIILLTAIARPVENLAIFVLPLAALAVFAETSFTSERFLAADSSPELSYHVLFSILSYSLLSIAAVQAILLAIQDHHLHHKHPAGFIRALPPLRDMEVLLFQFISAGFVLLTIALITGTLFLEDIFAQHLIHKTVLSIAAWIIFGVLLWGRWHYGWRGRTAIRWTLGGCFVLLLAYLGSKFVLEIILHR